MKKIIFFAVLFAVLFISCNQLKSPEEVALTFMVAYDNQDVETMTSLSCEETQNTIKMLNPFKEVPLVKAQKGSSNYTKANCTEENKLEMKCQICCDAKGKETQISLIKEKDGWKVKNILNKDQESQSEDEKVNFEKELDALDAELNQKDSLDTQ
jgi:hypothetical protein